MNIKKNDLTLMSESLKSHIKVTRNESIPLKKKTNKLKKLLVLMGFLVVLSLVKFIFLR